MSDANELLDIHDAGDFLNVSETSLRRWTNAGVLPCLRVGQRRERRFRRADLLAFMEHQPLRVTNGEARPADVPSPRPVEEAITLTQGSHLCGFYDSDLGRATLAVRFLLDGLQEESMVYLVASTRSTKHILKYLKQRLPSVERDIDAGKLLLSEYQKGPRAQIKDFERRLSAAAKSGTQSFRVFGDTWEMRKKTSAAGFVEYETGYDQLIARRFPVVTICAYDVRQFSGVAVLDALKAHRDTFRYPIERALA
ncbi:MAG TPA: MEDS domain-containing protein [Gemmatimonadaceae bacterium]|jgi:transcriptional repressor of dcmA and dcmR|nr:MEDS domain-containing protein [Gemmatimonadaceae bacterium]